VAVIQYKFPAQQKIFQSFTWWKSLP
jgi:hypothetical protein